MATEEFTFPISADTVRAFIDSPPLWQRLDYTQHTSTSSSSFSKLTEQLCSPTSHTFLTSPTRQRKSFSDIGGGIRGDHHRPIEMDGHDRMDLLWEDFNEELRWNPNPTAFNLPKTVNGGVRGGGRALVANNKVGLAVLAKVFKRLFLLRQQPVKKRYW